MMVMMSFLYALVHTQVLEEMGCEPLEGLPVLGGALLADLALTSAPGGSTSKVAVQRQGGLDGGGGGQGGGMGGSLSSGLSRNAPHEVLGEAVVERRLLELAGWRVVPVERHVWKVWEGPEEQLMYMHARLAEGAAEGRRSRSSRR